MPCLGPHCRRCKDRYRDPLPVPAPVPAGVVASIWMSCWGWTRGRVQLRIHPLLLKVCFPVAMMTT